MKIYALKDTKVGKFASPFQIPNDQVAIRSVKIIANDKNTEVGRYPADFDLYRLGEFNDDTGVITSNVEFVVNVQTLVEVNEDGNI